MEGATHTDGLEGFKPATLTLLMLSLQSAGQA